MRLPRICDEDPRHRFRFSNKSNGSLRLLYTMTALSYPDAGDLVTEWLEPTERARFFGVRAFVRCGSLRGVSAPFAGKCARSGHDFGLVTAAARKCLRTNGYVQTYPHYRPSGAGPTRARVAVYSLSSKVGDNGSNSLGPDLKLWCNACLEAGFPRTTDTYDWRLL